MIEIEYQPDHLQFDDGEEILDLDTPDNDFLDQLNTCKPGDTGLGRNVAVYSGVDVDISNGLPDDTVIFDSVENIHNVEIKGTDEITFNIVNQICGAEDNLDEVLRTVWASEPIANANGTGFFDTLGGNGKVEEVGENSITLSYREAIENGDTHAETSFTIPEMENEEDRSRFFYTRAMSGGNFNSSVMQFQETIEELNEIALTVLADPHSGKFGITTNSINSGEESNWPLRTEISVEFFDINGDLIDANGSEVGSAVTTSYQLDSPARLGETFWANHEDPYSNGLPIERVFTETEEIEELFSIDAQNSFADKYVHVPKDAVWYEMETTSYDGSNHLDSNFAGNTLTERVLLPIMMVNVQAGPGTIADKLEITD